MTPTLAFWLSLAVKMGVAATFVVLASLAAQRAGALVGAMIATLPVSAGPVYVFLALEHDAQFISDSALGSFAINAVTGLYSLTYAVLAQRRGLLVSLSAALAVWFALGALVRLIDWNIAGAAVFWAVLQVPCLLLSRPYRHAPMLPTVRRWYDLPLRAAMVGVLVVMVVVLSPYLGAFASGMLAVFPIVLTSIVLILHPRVGARATAAVIANTIFGLVGFAVALAALHLTAVPLGVWPAFALTLSISIGWNLMVLALRRRGIPL
jgi:hypothetical protein